MASGPLRPRPLSLVKSPNREPRSLFIFFPNSLCANPMCDGSSSLPTRWRTELLWSSRVNSAISGSTTYTPNSFSTKFPLLRGSATLRFTQIHKVTHSSSLYFLLHIHDCDLGFWLLVEIVSVSISIVLMYVLQWTIHLHCCHGGRESSSMCNGGARAGVAVGMVVVMLRLQWLWWQHEDELSMVMAASRWCATAWLKGWMQCRSVSRWCWCCVRVSAVATVPVWWFVLAASMGALKVFWTFLLLQARWWWFSCCKFELRATCLWWFDGVWCCGGCALQRRWRSSGCWQWWNVNCHGWCARKLRGGYEFFFLFFKNIESMASSLCNRGRKEIYGFG